VKKFFKSKWFLYSFYAVAILILTALQSTPHLFEILSVKPVLLLPFALAAATHKGEVEGAVISIICGILFDISINSPFGAYTFFFMVFGVSAGLLSRFLLQKSWFNFMFIVGISSLLIQFFDFFFNYILVGYSCVGVIFLTHHLLCAIYTTVISPIFYFGLKKIYNINY
jgi:rod shape-determining protein MreD